MTSVINNTGTGLQRRPNKDKKSQPNKGHNNVNNSSANDSNQNNHNSDKVKADPKLQPTAEQIRIASLMNDKTDDNDLKAKIDQIVELTGSSRDDAVVALHDCDNDTAKAIDMILELEGDSLDSQWMSTGKKKKPPKSASNATADENLKPDANRDQRGDHNRDGRGSRGGPRRGGGPPRLQKQNPNPRGGQRKPKELNRTSNDNKSDIPDDNVFKPSDPSLPSRRGGDRRGDRGGRGRGGPGRGRGSSGPFVGGSSTGGGAGRGSRTFQNRVLQGNDGFPNSIDTWTNSTADQNPTKPAEQMTVGNWSDIATNEDWSEEDWESSHMETKVFTPSTKISEKEEIEGRDTMSNLANNQGLSQFMSKSSVDSNQTMSSLLSSNVSRNANVTAGQTLLQQIQQSSTGQTPALNQYSMSYNKQVTDSIKSLVGLNSSANFPQNANDLLSNSDRDLDSLSSQPTGMSNKTSRTNRQTRPSKIPESAVEMPSNDTIAALGVHFGTLEFGSESNQFSLPTDFSDTVNNVKNVKKADSNSLQNSSMLGQTNESTYRPSTNNSIKDNKGVSSMTHNSVLGGHQSMTSDSLLDRSNKSNVGQFAHKVLDNRNTKSDYSSVPSQQSVSAADITSTYKTTYSSDTSYNSNNYSTTTPSNYSYSNSQSVYGNQAVGNYSTNFSGTSIGNTSNQKLRDMDTNSQSKQYDVSSNSVGTLGLNSTNTTNVLKNTLSATGKGVHSVPPGVATPVLSTPYIVQNPGVPIYPMGIPYDLQYQTSRDHNFGPYGTQDVKYGRGTDNEIPVSTSQAGVNSQTHNQTFATFPPGYGFYLAPGINMMPAQSLYPTQPLYPVQPQSTGSGGSAFGKANNTYGSHSYNSGYDSISAQTQDYVKQNYQQNKGITGSNTSDLSSNNSSIYGKNHQQMNKSYDKQGFQSATPAFNLTAGNQSAGNMSSTYGAPYVLPHSQQAMSLHTMSSLQSDVSANSGQGVSGQRSLSQSHKNSGAQQNSYAKYSWN